MPEEIEDYHPFVDGREETEGEEKEASGNEKEAATAATEISDLVKDWDKTMSVSSKKHNMGFQKPCIMCQHVEIENQLVSIDLLIPCVHRHSSALPSTTLACLNCMFIKKCRRPFGAFLFRTSDCYERDETAPNKCNE